MEKDNKNNLKKKSSKQATIKAYKTIKIRQSKYLKIYIWYIYGAECRKTGENKVIKYTLVYLN